MLLPPDGVDEEGEGPDPRAELAARLLEYQRYKEAAGELGERRLLGRDVFPARGLRPEPPPEGSPRLVLLLVVDQMRADYLIRFGHLFEGGLARLMKDGVAFTEAHHDHSATHDDHHDSVVPWRRIRTSQQLCSPGTRSTSETSRGDPQTTRGTSWSAK